MQKTPRQDQARYAQSTATTPRPGVMSGGLEPLSTALQGSIASLETRAREAFRLLHVVRAALPEPEKNHVLSASYRNEMLVIGVDSAAWTAHVRYREQRLRQHLLEAGEKPFTKLKVRVGLQR